LKEFKQPKYIYIKMESSADQVMCFINADKKQNTNSEKPKLENNVNITADGANGGNDGNSICNQMKVIIDSGKIGWKEYEELDKIHRIFCQEVEEVDEKKLHKE